MPLAEHGSAFTSDFCGPWAAPGAARAVAQANGALIGYGGGLWRKPRLLEIEL